MGIMDSKETMAVRLAVQLCIFKILVIKIVVYARTFTGL
jgi:hypothetical protein